MGISSGVAGLLIALLCIDVEALDFEANDGRVRVQQRTSVTRRKRDLDGMNVVEFPEEMTFDMEVGDDVHTLTLTQTSNFNSHAKVFNSKGQVNVYHWEFTGIYENADHHAVIAINCKDTTGCTLKGAFDVGSQRYKIDPPKQGEDSEFHRVRRADRDQVEEAVVFEVKKGGIVEHPELKPSKTTGETVSSDPKRSEGAKRKKRYASQCKIVELALVVDYEVYHYFLSENGLDEAAAIAEAILYMEIAVAEVNIRLCDFGDSTCCDHCVEVFPTSIRIDTVEATSWTNGRFTPGAVNPARIFLILPDEMPRCPTVAGAKAVVCVTGGDVAVRFPDGLYYSQRYVYYGGGLACDGTAPRGVVDFYHDSMSHSIAHIVGRALNALPDDESAACNNGNFIMSYDLWQWDSLADKSTRKPWSFSPCSCSDVCTYISNSGSCLDTVSLTDGELDDFIYRTYGGLGGGQTLSLDRQCEITYPLFAGATSCVPIDLEAICSDGIKCAIPTRPDLGPCPGSARVRAGTPCGHGKWCVKDCCECYLAALFEQCCNQSFCHVTNSVCMGNPGTCQCITNYEAVDGSCDAIIIPADDDCTGPGFCVTNSVCQTGTCICNDGYENIDGQCEEIDECESSPCINGDCTDLLDGFVCSCPPGWTGLVCDMNIDDCASNPCVNGNCSDLVNGYECHCKPGWTGVNCDTNIDDCASSPCNNGACTDLVDDFVCYCDPGWTGLVCDMDIDECTSYPCEYGKCYDMINGYECHCSPGWTGVNCDTNIDDCESNPCYNGNCTDLVDDFVCYCEPGWTGLVCYINIDDCASNPCVNGNCSDLVNGYECHCKPGWTGVNCDTDIDECTSYPCEYGKCYDMINGYECHCSPGWTGVNCDTNIDDCESNPCYNGNCTDLVDDFVCYCEPGWTGLVCYINIDDCASNPCVNGNCSDLVNGYECHCKPGWTGVNCDTDIDDCEPSPCIHGECTDLVDGFVCYCEPGWTGLVCDMDIDDCESSPCNNGNCTDLVDDFVCYCEPGWTGLVCDMDIDDCASNPCGMDGTCSDEVNGFTCDCISGITGTVCDTEINECESNPCVYGYCIDEFDGFYCHCALGWTGTICDTDVNECSASNTEKRDYYYAPVCMPGYLCVNISPGYQCVPEEK